jgi:outer membrane protein assembly factor BamA
LKTPLLLLAICLALASCVIAQNDSARPQPSTKLLAFPVIARSMETGWIFGGVTCLTFRVNKSDTVSRTSNMQALVLYSVNKQLVTVLNGTTYFPNEKYILNHRLSYSFFPDKFWGMGRQTPDSAEESYQFRQYFIFLHGMRKVAKSLFAGVLYEQQTVMQVNYEKSGVFDKQKVPGRKGYRVSGIGLSATYDNRNNAFAPDKGSFLQMTSKHFFSAIGSDFDYTTLVQDFRQYIPVYKKNVLALQLYNCMNIGGDIPLRSLAALGGDNCMRGYYSGRYRDKQQIALQAECRMQVCGQWGVVAFGSAGDVARKVMGYDFKGMKYAYGGGLRCALNKKEKLNLRLDYGFTSNKNQGFYLQLGEAF